MLQQVKVGFLLFASPTKILRPHAKQLLYYYLISKAKNCSKLQIRFTGQKVGLNLPSVLFEKIVSRTSHDIDSSVFLSEWQIFLLSICFLPRILERGTFKWLKTCLQMVYILNMLLFSTFTFTNMLRETTHGNIEQLGYAFNELCYKKHSAVQWASLFRKTKFLSRTSMPKKENNNEFCSTSNFICIFLPCKCMGPSAVELILGTFFLAFDHLKRLLHLKKEAVRNKYKQICPKETDIVLQKIDEWVLVDTIALWNFWRKKLS